MLYAINNCNNKKHILSDMTLYMSFLQPTYSKNRPMNVDDEFYFIKQQ